MSGAAAAVFNFANTLAVDVTPETPQGYFAGGGASNITTGSVLASPSGGVTPYTYSWARVGTGPYTWTIGSSTAATTNFTAQSVPEGVADQAIFEVTATDATGAVGRARVTAAAINNTPYYSGGFVP